MRIIFRLVEFSRGSDVSNPLLTSEAFFYALEAVPMLLAVASFNVTHPGVILVGPASEMPGFFATTKNTFRRRRGHRKMVDESDEAMDLSGYESVHGK